MKNTLFLCFGLIWLGGWTVASVVGPKTTPANSSLYQTARLTEDDYRPSNRNDSGDRQKVRLEDMIGQMLVVGFTGTSPRQHYVKAVAQQLAEGKIGGVLFMSWNVQSGKQVRKLTHLFSSASPSPAPLLAVDQEGGRVQRLGKRQGFHRYPSAKRVGAHFSLEEATTLYEKLARELKESGFNFNLGPVIDLDIQRRNPIIGRKGRSFGAEPELVSSYAEAFIVAHRKAGVLTSVKHFPGHGSSRTDSHRRLVDISDSWKATEISPYKSLADKGLLDTVMVGHLYHPEVAGPKKVPASLSRQAIKGILRKDIGFDGVVITDDLEMGAITRNYKFEDSLIQAVNAGNDILLLSNRKHRDVRLPQKAIKAIAAAVRKGRIAEGRIRQSYLKILRLKKRLNRPVVFTDSASTQNFWTRLLN